MALNGTNSEQTRSYNRRVVLEAVRMHGPISRAEIARLTSLAAQTVSNIAGELEEVGLLRNQGRRRAGRGQPPVELALNPEGGYTVGLQLDHGRISGLLVNLVGNVRERTQVPMPHPTPRHALPLMAQLVEQLIRKASVPRDRVIGVGVVMPGPFDVDGLTSVGPTTIPGWQGVALEAELSRQIGLPVLVDNDATAAAVGEHLYGAAKALRHYFYLFVGMGLGAGLFIDGQPNRGAWGNAGEIGHMIVEPGGRPCPCGNFGCLERYVSVHAALEVVREGHQDVHSIEQLAKLATVGDPLLDKWLDMAAPRLSVAINAVENLLDPEVILIGGVMPEPLLDGLLSRLEPLLPSVSDRRDRTYPRVIRATAGAAATTLGAAILPIFNQLNPSLPLLFKGSESHA